MQFTRTPAFHWVLLGAMAALGLMLFWPAVYKISYAALHRHGSSHGVFIPFLAAYFIYLKRERLKTFPFYCWLPGAAALLLLTLVPSIFPAAMDLQFIAFILFVALSVLVALGKAIFREVLFPIVFAVTMIPIPPAIYDKLADLTRHVTFSTSLAILSVLDIPFYKEGWLIKLPNALLEVAISCSGIRYMISYFVFGIAYAYLFRQSTLGRTLLVAATIPISLAASSLRLTIIFLATYFISPRIAEYWPHVILSWCVFFAILFGLIMIDQHFLAKGKAPHNLAIASQADH